jgi:hypothetical protein
MQQKGLASVGLLRPLESLVGIPMCLLLPYTFRGGGGKDLSVPFTVKK